MQESVLKKITGAATPFAFNERTYYGIIHPFTGIN
jgi:hypothetical protein